MSTTTTIRRRERTTRRQSVTSAETLDAARVRRWAQQWPEYEAELLALAEQTETSQQTAAA